MAVIVKAGSVELNGQPIGEPSGVYANERAFLEATDETLLLIFADWLDEQGDLRGNAIRLVGYGIAITRRNPLRLAWSNRRQNMTITLGGLSRSDPARQ